MSVCHSSSRWVLAAGMSVLLCGGCQTGQVFYRPPAVLKTPVPVLNDRVRSCDTSVAERPRRLKPAALCCRTTVHTDLEQFVLASDVGVAAVHPATIPARPLSPSLNTKTTPLTTQPAGAIAGAVRPATQPASPSTQPARKLPYTAPSATSRQMTLFVAVGGLALPKPMVGAGKEMAESSLTTPGGIQMSGPLGLPGLSAPQPGTASAVVSQPGLQRGFAAGLGFAAPQTIFMYRPNLLANPCRDLVRAGFFPNQAACEICFRR